MGAGPEAFASKRRYVWILGVASSLTCVSDSGELQQFVETKRLICRGIGYSPDQALRPAPLRGNMPRRECIVISRRGEEARSLGLGGRT